MQYRVIDDGDRQRRGRGRSRRALLFTALVPAFLLSFAGISYADFPVTQTTHNSWAHGVAVTNICFEICPQTQSTSVVVHQANTDRGIFVCELQHPGDAIGRAKCFLDAIRYTCGAIPLRFPPQIPQPNFDRYGECQTATGYGFASQMATALRNVTGSYECVRYDKVEHFVPTDSISRRWRAVNSGTFGCPG
jgi:hypothetical protein